MWKKWHELRTDIMHGAMEHMNSEFMEHIPGCAF